MKILKKLLLTTSLCTALAVSTSATTVTEQFSDVDNTWYTQYVQKAVDSGYAAGKSTTSFDPLGNVTGAELSVMLCNAFYGKEVLSQQSQVTGDGGWGEAWINTIKAMNPSGNANKFLSSLDFYSPLTRFEASYLIGILLESKNTPVATGDFSHLTDISTAAYSDYLNLTLSSGIMAGKTTTTFDGTGNLTRAESCVIITNLLKNIMEESYQTYNAQSQGNSLSTSAYESAITTAIGEIDAMLEKVNYAQSQEEYITAYKNFSEFARSSLNLVAPSSASGFHELVVDAYSDLANLADQMCIWMSEVDGSKVNQNADFQEEFARLSPENDESFTKILSDILDTFEKAFQIYQ